MNKKESITVTAAGLIHEKGYNSIGIKGILDELDIPKGSFYYYFKSKEELGIAIIELYIDDVKKAMEGCDDSLDGLVCFFNIFFQRLIEMEMKRGCPIGNLVLELSDAGETFRLKLLEWYLTVEDWISRVLDAQGVSSAALKAKMLIASFEGAMMISKLDKDDIHFKLFTEHTFRSIIES